jgi:hypothetical protein
MILKQTCDVEGKWHHAAMFATSAHDDAVIGKKTEMVGKSVGKVHGPKPRLRKRRPSLSFHLPKL